MKTALSALFTLVGIATTQAADWPRWRGPDGNGVAPDANPPSKWSETENIKWKVKIPGRGSATPIVLGDKVFVVSAIPVEGKAPAPETPAPKPPGTALNDTDRLLAATGNLLVQAPPPPPAAGEEPRRRRPGGGGGGGRAEAPSSAQRFVVMALDRNTGKTIWEKTAREQVPHEGHHRDGTFASGSPVTDGEHLYVSFGSFGLYCYDLKGELKWEKDLGDMRTRNAFGEGSSPVVHGDTLVINWDHEGDDFIVAFDKRTGKELWRKQRDEPTNWSTPVVLEHEGRTQLIVSATNKIRSYDLKTGDQFWECGGMTTNVIPTPVSGFGMVYAISGFRGASLLAIKLGAKGTIDNTDAIAWKHGKSTPYVPSPVLAGERLYFFSGNTGVLSCFNAKTGQPYYEATRVNDLGGGVYASPVAVADRVFLTGRDGKSVVIKNADAFEVLASNKLDDRIDASPAISGRDMFMRGSEHLYCIAEPAK